MFNALRDWRAEQAKEDGVPPYIICTNKQLGAIVKARPGSLSQLGEIDGIGKAKIEKYGQIILGMLVSEQYAETVTPDILKDDETRDGKQEE